MENTEFRYKIFTIEEYDFICKLLLTSIDKCETNVERLTLYGALKTLNRRKELLTTEIFLD